MHKLPVSLAFVTVWWMAAEPSYTMTTIMITSVCPMPRETCTDLFSLRVKHCLELPIHLACKLQFSFLEPFVPVDNPPCWNVRVASNKALHRFFRVFFERHPEIGQTLRCS